MRRTTVFVVLSACTFLSSCTDLSFEGEGRPSGDADSAGPTSGYLRVVKVFERPWEADCSGGECGREFLVSIDTPLPKGLANFDVTVTVTMDYMLSASDAAQLHLFNCPIDTPPVPCPLQFLPPDPFPLLSSVDPTTTTLTWFGDDFSVGGYEGWHYALLADLQDGSGDAKARMSGSKMTVVVEMARG